MPIEIISVSAVFGLIFGFMMGLKAKKKKDIIS